MHSAAVKAVKDDIPDGWKMLIDFSTREKKDRNGSHGNDYQHIQRACEENAIRAFKQSGCWVVNSLDASRLLAARDKVKIPSTIGTQKTAESDIERLVKSIDIVAFRVDLASDAIVSVNKPLMAIHEVLSQIRDAIVDLKTPALVEQKQEMGPY
jgi:hypothetical protein